MMATKTNLTIWSGTDQRYSFAILDADQSAAVDITGWTLSWMLKRVPSLADSAASIVKRTDVASGITIAGTYNATPGVNAQRATVLVEDADTDTLAPNIYHYELKRMDAGLEAVLAYGTLVLIQSVHRQ
jgi:hypothetical protein